MNALKLILIALLSLAPLGLKSEEATATVMSVTGKAVYQDPQGDKQDVKAGTLLRSGTRLGTASGASVQLMLADGSKLTLGANTEITLTEMTKADGAFGNVFNLLKGVIRATVQKLATNSKFEVASVHGVAAVKGTEYEAEVSDDGMDVRVKEGRVWLSDAQRQRVEEIKERHRARAIKNSIEHAIEMKKEEWERFRDWARAEVPKAPKGEEYVRNAIWESLRPDQKLKVLRALRASLGDTFDDIVNLSEEERQAHWKERVRAVDERKLAVDEARVDFRLGKSIIDRKGRRVRFDEFILRPSADKVQFLNYSRREGRTDLVNAINTYNQNLPVHLGEARGINQRAWYQVAAPTYWVVRSTVMFANDMDDSLFGDTHFYDPVRVGLFQHWELPVQSFELWVNTPVVIDPIISFSATGASTASGGTLLEAWKRAGTLGLGAIIGAGSSGATPVGSAAGNNMVAASVASSSDLQYVDGIGGAGMINAPTQRALTSDELGSIQGDFAGGVRRTYKDASGTYIDLKSYAIDENGKVRNVQDLLQNRSLLDMYLDLAFRTYQEIELDTPLFTGRGDIDVVSQMLWWSTITKNSNRL